MFNKLVLADQTDRNHGYTSSDSKDDLMGLEGVALTSLRPAGTVLIQERRVDVVSVGEFIEKGAQVKVVDTSGSALWYRALVKVYTFPFHFILSRNNAVRCTACKQLT